ncbi:MAG: sugar transferase [Verrucomicrobiota bacterium]
MVADFDGSDFLRRSGIASIPQFLNVFRGEMSVIGPRPHRESEDRHYAAVAETFLMRRFLKPGVTGLAQIRGARSGARNSRQAIRNRSRWDNLYLKKWSLWLDVWIVIVALRERLRPSPSGGSPDTYLSVEDLQTPKIALAKRK